MRNVTREKKNIKGGYGQEVFNAFVVLNSLN